MDPVISIPDEQDEELVEDSTILYGEDEAEYRHGSTIRANDSMEDHDISLTEPSPPNSSPDEGAAQHNILLPPLHHPLPPLPADLQLPPDLGNLYEFGRTPGPSGTSGDSRVSAEPEEELDEEARIQRHIQSDISPEEYDRIAWHIVGSHFTERGLVRQQLDSFDTFMEHDIQRIMDELSTVTVVQELDYKKLKYDEKPMSVSWRFEQVYLSKPQGWEGGNEVVLSFPQEARLRNLTYSGAIYVDISQTIERNNKKEKRSYKKVYLGKVPVMVRSKFCLLNDKVIEGPTELAAVLECPLDPGGYFIVNGSEKVVVAQERMAPNQIYVHHSTIQKYEYSAEFSSVVTNSSRPPCKLVLHIHRPNKNLGNSLDPLTTSSYKKCSPGGDWYRSENGPGLYFTVTSDVTVTERIQRILDNIN